MPSGYRKGAIFENDIKDILLEDDWAVVRAAGSHGIVDIMAVKYGVIWFIQCRKAGHLSPDERKELISLAKKHKALPILAYKSKEGIVFEEVKPKEPTFHYEIQHGEFVKVEENG